MDEHLKRFEDRVWYFCSSDYLLSRLIMTSRPPRYALFSFAEFWPAHPCSKSSFSFSPRLCPFKLAWLRSLTFFALSTTGDSCSGLLRYYCDDSAAFV